MSAMEVAMNGNTAAISELQQAVSGDGQSLASKFENISASVDLTGDAAIGATLAGADESDRQRKATGKIRREQKVLSDQQQAMATTIEQLDADFQAESADLRGQIINEQTVRATETGALAQRVGTVESEFKAADNALNANISEVAKTSADANQATATKLEQLSAKTGNIESAVQHQSEAIADLENGAQAMWTTKVQAGDITAGIGLVAKDDGTSQVALSASQVFVFDPNSATPLAPLFAIDNGQTVIAEAIIRKATIQIIQSEKITADYIKAGVSITTPLINGGQIDMGNAFMAGGAAGFGKGGPYGSWGWGWHTIIYSDGSIYTNKLNAEGGYIRNITIGNCIIDEDCVVKGTVYADRIVGDVYSAKDYYCAVHNRQRGPIEVCRIKVNQSVGFARTLTIPKLSAMVGARAVANGFFVSNSSTMRVSVQLDGVTVKQFDVTVRVSASGGGGNYPPVINEAEELAIIGDIIIPPITSPLVTVIIQIVSGDGWVRSDSSLAARVALFKQGSSLS